MASWTVAIFLCFYPLGCLSQIYTYTTVPIQSPGEDEIIVQAIENEANVSVSCTIRFTENNTQIQTQWGLLNENEIVMFNMDTGLASDHSYLSVANDLTNHANLTITTFTIDRDRLQLGCASLEGLGRIFVFGIPVGPILEPASIKYNVTEANSFFLNLTGSSSPFPPYVTSTWTLDGNDISDPNITLGDYTINIDYVKREYSGKLFQLSTTNGVGTATEDFTLNVQYGPEGDGEDHIVYASIGDTITLIAATNVDGNPFPFYGWGFGNIQVNLTGRYSSNSTGQLTIENVMAEDFGPYVFGTNNGIGDDFTIDVTLTEAVIPSSPEDISFSDLTDTQITLMWNPPVAMGFPTLSGYIIDIYPPVPADVELETNTTSIVLYKLTPGTVYNVSVRAVSSYYINGGERSQYINFTTFNGAPAFESVTSNPEDGNIEIQWTLKHTGGFDNDEIIIQVICATIDDITEIDGSGNINRTMFGLSYMCSDTCIDDNLMGSGTVGPVSAGIVYSCYVTVQVDNTVGMDSQLISDIVPTIGIPSSPIVTVESGAGYIIVTVRSESGGVPSDDNSFLFRIIVINENDVVIHNMSYSLRGYASNSTEKFTINLPIGEYTVSVTSQNKYGTSEEATTISLSVVLAPSPSPSPTDTSTSDGVSLAIIIGASVGGVVFIILIISMILCFIYCCYRMSKTNDKIPTGDGFEMYN